MASTVTMKVIGLSELGRRMSTLKSDIAIKVSRSATGAAAQVIKKLAKEKIQHNDSSSGDAIDKGSLLESVIVKRLPNSQTQLTSEHIVTVRGRGKTSKKTGIKQREAPHAHFVEFGTVNMPAEPFLRPAFDQGKGKALDAMVNRLRKRIEKGGRMSLESDLYAALASLVGNRVAAVEFPQPPLRPTWPAIRYTIITTPIQDICGDGDDLTSEHRVQLDVVAMDFDTVRSLRLQVLNTMASFSPPARLENSFSTSDTDTKTKREILEYSIHGST